MGRPRCDEQSRQAVRFPDSWAARADLDTVYEREERIPVGQGTDFLNALNAHDCASSMRMNLAGSSLDMN